jgi:hypothetical protein
MDDINPYVPGSPDEVQELIEKAQVHLIDAEERLEEVQRYLRQFRGDHPETHSIPSFETWYAIYGRGEALAQLGVLLNDVMSTMPCVDSHQDDDGCDCFECFVMTLHDYQ